MPKTAVPSGSIRGPQGPQGAQGAQGVKGDGGAAGAAGAQGGTGAAGADGKTLIYGNGAPTSTVGAVGDSYIDQVAVMIYGPKTSSGWPNNGYALTGPRGNTGATGATGATGSAGATGATGPQGPAGADASLGTRRAVSTDTTLVAGETLSVSTANGNRVISQPTTAPVAGQRTYVEKSDTGTGTVLLNWTINDDTTGVRLNTANAGVTLIVTADGGYHIESATPTGVSRGGSSGTATSAVPPAAGPRTGFYDPLHNLYIPGATGLRGLRAAVAKAALAVSPQLVEIVCGGDSRTDGFPVDTKNAWPNQIKAMLSLEGIPNAGTGFVMAGKISGITDARLSQTGTWTDAPPRKTWGASGSTSTFVSDSPGTIVEVWFRQGSGAFTVSIDGATAVTQAATSGSGIQKYTVTGLTNANHTVKVTSSSASGVLVGFVVRGTTGLLVHNVAIGGWTSTQWAQTGAGTLQEITNLINPAVFGLMLGCNDPANSIPAATTATNLATIMAANANAARYLINETPAPANQGAWVDYVRAMYDRADASVIPLFDLNDRFGTPAQGNAAGLLGSDSLHETLAGANDIARGVTRMLTG